MKVVGSLSHDLQGWVVAPFQRWLVGFLEAWTVAVDSFIVNSEVQVDGVEVLKLVPDMKSTELSDEDRFGWMDWIRVFLVGWDERKR